VKGRDIFFYHMARSITQMKIPTKPDGSMDMKKILLPVSSYIRLYALRSGVRVINSRHRAQMLLENKVFSDTLYEELMQAFDFITHLRIRSQAARIARDEVPGNTTDMSQLNQIEILTLKKHLQNIAGLQTRLSGDFGNID
jgi:signal-transduction protein with cAMP-binding, CBS, and nucleotidyltransferase domain